MSSLDALEQIPAPPPVGSGAVEESAALWTALARLGLGHVVVAPGSRSAPLVYALDAVAEQEGLGVHVRIDERAAAFTALGLSRHDARRPATVITTSGTATAHLLAAVMEAHHARIPLLVITADRPAELRGTGANQVTAQPGLYSAFVRFEADLPAPGATAADAGELRTAVSTAARAIAAATGEHPGPVHLNLGFRDPLVPAAGQVPVTAQDAGDSIVLTRRTAPRTEPVRIDGLDARTVVVAGDGAGRQALDLAAAQELPLLAEPSSGARAGEQLVAGYPAVLREVMADREHPLRPRRAVVVGHATLSRPVLRDLLGAQDVEVVVVDPHSDFADPVRRASSVLPALQAPPVPADERERRRSQVRAWQERAAALQSPADQLPWQVRAALTVWDAAEPGDTLVLGSSSLVRDLEAHAGPTAARVLANRGLAGIDGTIAMASGIALAARRGGGRVRALMGDLTALHDLTGLVIGPLEEQPSLDLVVVDDGGGRIFGGLEHAAAPASLLERFFTTPHGTDIAAAAEALGARAQRVAPATLAAALATPDAGRRLLVVQESSSAPAVDARDQEVDSVP